MSVIIKEELEVYMKMHHWCIDNIDMKNSHRKWSTKNEHEQYGKWIKIHDAEYNIYEVEFNFEEEADEMAFKLTWL